MPRQNLAALFADDALLPTGWARNVLLSWGQNGHLTGVRTEVDSQSGEAQGAAAQGALAWLWAKSAVNIPIAGFKSLAQAEENARAMTFGPLNAEQLRQIDEALGA